MSTKKSRRYMYFKNLVQKYRAALTNFNIADPVTLHEIFDPKRKYCNWRGRKNENAHQLQKDES